MENLLKKLLQGKIKPYQLGEKIWKEKYNQEEGNWSKACKEASDLRLKFLEEKLNKNFSYIRKNHVPSCSEKKLTTGIEQKIGSAAVPLGFAGPLKIKGKYAKGEFYIPLATNEAALVAGLNRGCRAINESGKVRTVVTRDCMTRSPLLEAPDIGKAKELCEEVKKEKIYKRIKRECEKESKVTELIDLQPFQLGRYVHLRFVFQTGDSMGMNSATRYSAAGVKVLTDKYEWVRLKSLTGNMCSDKKASHINVLLGRGKTVETEVKIDRKTIEKIYKTTPEGIVKLNHLKNYEGSALAGNLGGFNANAANTIAAMFIATGQDAAQVVESSSCFTRAEVKNGNLLFGVTLPCLEVATAGGGTGFGTAKECLDMLGCQGYGKSPGANARKLAEIIGAAVTAQELNLLGTQVDKYELAESHIRLARGE